MVKMTGLDDGADRYRAVDVPVRGGNLRVGVWQPSAGANNPDGATIVVIHGLTASHRSWVRIAEQLPGFRIIAPDLRGRGRSNGLPGPFGMVQHADDVAAVMDFLAVPDAVIVGHSMGGFVAVVFSARHRDRVRALLLVDGGVPLPAPSGGISIEAVVAALGPAAERLSMTFPDRESYRQFFRAHPAFVDDWNDAVADYVDYDLCGQSPELRSAMTFAALAEDSAELYGSEVHLAALAKLPSPTTFLRAPRGFFNDEPGLWAPDWIRQWQERLPALDVREVGGVNHYTIQFNDRGVAAVVAAARAAAAEPGRS